MNDSDFITIFNAADMVHRDWWLPGYGLVGIVTCVLFLKGLAAGAPSVSRKVPTLILWFVVFWTVGVFLLAFSTYLKGRETLLLGRTNYVEGFVQNFIPAPFFAQVGDPESFAVRGVPFHYCVYVDTPGFNYTATHGGPIRQGLYARIWYSGNDILKLVAP